MSEKCKLKVVEDGANDHDPAWEVLDHPICASRAQKEA